MKRFLIAISLGLFFILRVSPSFAAVDLSIGGTAWYIWWDPAWADAKTTTVLYMDPAVFVEDSHDFKPTSNIMGGPVISISFLERWSIQSVFTIGTFVSAAKGLSTDAHIGAGDMGMALSHKKYVRDIVKWDSDTSIGCAINRVVKIFAGFKSQGYTYEERMHDFLFLNPTVMVGRILKDEVRAFGGGVGVGLTIPLVTDFYMMMTASGVALWSQEKIRMNHLRTYSLESGMPLSYLPLMPDKGRYFSYGGSAALSFAYVIAKINTTISAGGRYQLLFNRQRYNDLFRNDVSMNIIDRQYDHFFGVTLSAIYTFHIGKRG